MADAHEQPESSTAYSETIRFNKRTLEQKVNTFLDKDEEEYNSRKKAFLDIIREETHREEKRKKDRNEEDKIKNGRIKKNKIERNKIERKNIEEENIEKDKIEEENIEKDKIENEKAEKDKNKEEEIEKEKIRGEKIKQEEIKQEEIEEVMKKFQEEFIKKLLQEQGLNRIRWAILVRVPWLKDNGLPTEDILSTVVESLRRDGMSEEFIDSVSNDILAISAQMETGNGQTRDA
ncbi:hypothetical protein T069G_04240 [Trichoderma breve]|uniref:Uncharacterized protein n=1 Tax=Trichoderma breve TaxID=2034170 RepID=A0A9W9EAU9_9HYPO|nr:hypothetical protein T069G_04240 [Trichoderma breve]KAJ4863286.1 hypothetical protein T069G_04240 [Trichoderma breve]